MNSIGWIIFLIIGFSHGLFYAIYRIDIFEWHADPDEPIVTGNNLRIYPKRKLLKEKREFLKKAPWPKRADHFLHIFLGIIIGWFLLWILIDKRIDLFCNPNFKDLGIADLILFLLGWIGINGRLPSIAHVIVDFMKSGISIGR